MTGIIDTPLLIVGGGPAALVLAQLAGGASLGSLVVGHRSRGQGETVELSAEAVALLQPHGVINVLLPYAERTEPMVIDSALFEQVLKHHCVVSMNITVYDGFDVSNLVSKSSGVSATISDGRSQWQVEADRMVNTARLPVELNAAICEGAAFARRITGQAWLT